MLDGVRCGLAMLMPICSGVRSVWPGLAKLYGVATVYGVVHGRVQRPDTVKQVKDWSETKSRTSLYGPDLAADCTLAGIYILTYI